MLSIISLIFGMVGTILYGYVAQLEDVQDECIQVKAQIKRITTRSSGEQCLRFEYWLNGKMYEYAESTYLPLFSEGMTTFLYVNEKEPELCIPFKTRIVIMALYAVIALLFSMAVICSLIPLFSS